LVLAGLSEPYPSVERRFADMGHQGLGGWTQEQLGWPLVIVKRPRRWAWVPVDQHPPETAVGFSILPKHWVVERTFTWLTRNRRLTKDWERPCRRLDYPDTL
jgi:hypothetical protein